MQQVTLCYIRHAGRLLLIYKKRGLGAGKINGPGGKVDPGETPLAAAIRETQEETGLTPVAPELRGELRFHFANGGTSHCLIFLAEAYEGTLRETDEAIPAWHALDALPYGEMWSDDREWLPHLLTGKRFSGEVTIGENDATSHIIAIIDNKITIS